MWIFSDIAGFIATTLSRVLVYDTGRDSKRNNDAGTSFGIEFRTFQYTTRPYSKVGNHCFVN